MSITQQNWLDTNASRQYPVDDAATCVDDAGHRLPSDIIVDMQLRWPSNLGQYAFIGGVTVTRTIVTAVILAADAADAAATFSPIASISVRQPVAGFGVHTVQPLAAGVGGFIAFGDLSENCSLRFSSPTQSLLSSRVARAYSPLPVTSIRKRGRADSLKNLVSLLGENDIEVVKDTRVIDNVSRDVIIVRLRDQTAARNPLALYTGPCGGRPESNTCEQPGIQTINGIGPDCDGNINIEFRNLVAVGYHNCGGQHAGTTLDQPVTLADVCPDKSPVRFLGRDFCNGGATLPIPDYGDDGGTGGGEPTIPDGSSNSIGELPCLDLPFQDCFDGLLDDSWVNRLGQYALVDGSPSEEYPCAAEDCIEPLSARVFADVFVDEDDEDIWAGVFTGDVDGETGQTFGDVFDDESSVDVWDGVFTGDVPVGGSLTCTDVIVQSLQLRDTEKRNILVWENCGSGDSVGKKITTQIQMVQEGSQHNAGITLNYQTVDPYTNPRVTFLVAQINKNANKLQLVRFNGTTTILENSITPPVPFVFDDWYEMQVTTTAVLGAVLITVTVRNVTTPDWPAIELTLLTNLWGPSTGYFGLHTLMSVANFGFWRVEDA